MACATEQVRIPQNFPQWGICVMDSPFVIGFFVIAAVWCLGYIGENWSWSRPAAVVLTLALIGWQFLGLVR